MRKYDRSLIEVWEWKEKVYQDVKNLSAKEYIERVKEDSAKILRECKVKLKTISLKEKHQKVG